MKVGLTGFAGAGKTTVFTALTGLAPRPERAAQVGTIKVPDERVDALASIFKPRKSTYAEVAFVVEDGHQGAGIGTMLFRELAARARAEGVRRFVAETLYENTRMQAVLKHSGLQRSSTWADGVVHVVLELEPSLV